MNRRKISLRQELPLLIWLVLVWAALWQDFSAGNLIFGLIVALIVTRVFYLPPVQLSGRFNVWYFIQYAGIFLWKVITASLQVSYVILTQGSKVRSGVVAVQLRSHSDLIVTLTGHVISLIPGSLIVEVDRSSSTLYLHALDVKTPEDVEKLRKEVRDAESWVIRVMGTKAELAELKESAAPSGGAK